MTDITITEILETSKRLDTAAKSGPLVFKPGQSSFLSNSDVALIIHLWDTRKSMVAEVERLQERTSALEAEYKDLDEEAEEMVNAVISDDVGAWECVCSLNPHHEGHCPVSLRNEVKTVFAEVALLRRRLAKSESTTHTKPMDKAPADRTSEHD